MHEVKDRLPEVQEYLILDTGYTTAHQYIARRDGTWKRVKFPATCVLFRHPSEGFCLFDTGYAPRFFTTTRQFPEKIYALATPVVCSADTTVTAQLLRLGAVPSDVRHVFVSHFHADHVAGLRDFPEATIWCSRTAWNHTNELNGFAAVRRGILRALEPDDLADRLRFFEDQTKVSRTDCWDHHFDVFADGIFKIIDLPGHARGQIGLLNAPEEFFLVADAIWRTDALREGILPFPTVRLFFDDWAAYKNTFLKLRAWWAARPEVRVLCCHDL